MEQHQQLPGVRTRGVACGSSTATPPWLEHFTSQCPCRTNLTVKIKGIEHDNSNQTTQHRGTDGK
ncbi:hypothetical protein EYF80_065180 [Liparis tanakae]|uniref:Uncharacterized protein n=1 Tax=Liparis tanakae TaxID=230148 RepID=A0A4Z2E7Q8_9TELE|nr:hypothetical protein EYF80_065180 [Liparis tanakae]